MVKARAMSVFLAWAVVKATQIPKKKGEKILTILTTNILPYDITLGMLAFLFLSKVATLTQSNSLSAIFPYVHFCPTAGQKQWHSSIRGK